MVLNYKYRLKMPISSYRKIDNYIYEYNQAYNSSISLIQKEGRYMYDNNMKSNLIFNVLYKKVRSIMKRRNIHDKSALTQDALRHAYNTLFTNIKQNKPFTLHFRDSSSLEGSFPVRTNKLIDRTFGVKFKTILHRPIPIGSRIMGARIKRENKRYYIIYTVTDDTPDVKPQGILYNDVIGMDSNQGNYTFSNGYTLDFVKSVYPKLESKRLKAQKKLSSKKKGSKNRRKARGDLFNTSRKIKNRRNDDVQKRVTKVLNEVKEKVIVVEKLDIKSMTKKNLTNRNKAMIKNMLHITHNHFFSVLAYKATLNDRFVLSVDPKYTSMTCSRCGSIKKMPLTARTYSCSCGLNIDRDLNAAINIRRAGSALCH